MRIQRLNLLEQTTGHILIPTNLDVDSQGRAVMGAGLALAAKKRWLGIERTLGEYLIQKNYEPRVLVERPNLHVWSFPTKGGSAQVEAVSEVLPQYRVRYPVGSIAPGWVRPSSLALIRSSAEYIASHTTESVWSSKPGCGLGLLDWEVVREQLELAGWTTDRFNICYL